MELSESFNIKKGVRQGCPLSPISFNLFINDIFIIVINMASLLVINVVVEVFLQMTLCYVLQQDPQLKKLLKFASKWAKNNKMQFGINKCASLVVRGEVSRFLYNSNPTFYLSSRELPKRIAIST